MDVAYYVITTAVELALDLHFSYVNLFLSWLIFKIVQEEKMKIQNEILVPNKNVHKAKQFVCIRVLYYKLINNYKTAFNQSDSKSWKTPNKQ